jgi:hypothetical protein
LNQRIKQSKAYDTFEFDVVGQNAYSVGLSEQVAINLIHVFTEKKRTTSRDMLI